MGDALQVYWKRHIENKPIYRVFSSEFERDIRRFGLDPKRNPYKKIYPKIRALFKLLLKLERKQNFGHRQDWGKKDLVEAEYIIRVSLDDMKEQFIDFTPNLCQVRYYKNLMQGKGSALVTTIRHIVKDILKRKPQLTSKECILTKELERWVDNRAKHKIKVLKIMGSCQSLETALMSLDDERVKSPFGRLSHFRSIIQKCGLRKYRRRLECNPRNRPSPKTKYYLRVRSPIASKDISFVHMKK